MIAEVGNFGIGDMELVLGELLELGEAIEGGEYGEGEDFEKGMVAEELRAMADRIEGKEDGA